MSNRDHDRNPDPAARRRRVLRTVIVLAVVAVGIYAAFIASGVLGSAS